MKVALLTPTFSYFSGIDHVVKSQAEEMVKKGHKVTIFCLQSDIKADSYDVRILGMPRLSVLQRIYRLLMFINIPLIIRVGRELKDYDEIVSHFYPMNWFAWYSQKVYRRKYVYYDYGITTPSLFTNFIEVMYMKLFNTLNNFTVKSANEAISISKYLSHILKQETGLESKVIYPKIDIMRFNKKVKDKIVRKKYNLKSFPVLLFIGRISPHKGVHLLLEVFNLVKKEIPDVKLLIVGKKTFSSYFQELEKKAEKGVIFTGYIPEKDKPQYYAACNLYVTCTLWEGYNLPLAEAQACGKRVVAFNVCAHPEVVKAGVLVKEKDTKAFAKAIIKLLQKSYK